MKICKNMCSMLWIVQNVEYNYLRWLYFFILFLLAHLSRRLTGELIVYQSSRRPSVRGCVRLSVNTFKHEYLCNQSADWNEILSKASFGWGKASVGFGPDRIRTLVSMATDSSHRLIMGKTASSRFLKCF